MTATDSTQAPEVALTKVCTKCMQEYRSHQFFKHFSNFFFSPDDAECKWCHWSKLKDSLALNRGILSAFGKRECIDCKEVKNNNQFHSKQFKRCIACHFASKERMDNRQARERRGEDVLKAITSSRAAICSAVAKRYSKISREFFLLGCTHSELIRHIESKFQDGMSWENRDQWHIDHIIPLATAKTEEDVIRLNHYTNLRPLWAIDNLRKGAKLDFAI